MSEENFKEPHLGKLINRAQTKKYLLEVASRKKLSSGEPRFTRVSAQTMQDVEDKFRVLLNSTVANLTSSGRTI